MKRETERDLQATSPRTPFLAAPTTRRAFLGASALGAIGLARAGAAEPEAKPEVKPDAKPDGSAKPRTEAEAPEGAAAPPRLRLGLVTYNIAKDWTIETLIKNCEATHIEAVELRTTHAHGVELSLTPERRKEVRSLFEKSRVELASLGSTYEFHSADLEELKRNIAGAKEYARLAADVGAKGIKVRPNGLQTAKGIPAETTLRQIGESLAEVAADSAKVGVDVRLEVHGNETSRLPNVKKILDAAGNPRVFACWNSNDSDLQDGGLEANFALVKDRIGFVHMRDLFLEHYPFRKLFRLLLESGYRGVCAAEIPESADPIRVLLYYRALFLAYQDII